MSLIVSSFPLSIHPARTSAHALDEAGPDFVGVTDDNRLVSFNKNGEVLANAPLTGLSAGEKLIGLDFDPSSQMIFGWSNRARLYKVNLSNFTLTLIGSNSSFLFSDSVAIEFDGVNNEIRIITSTGDNVLINSATGFIKDILGRLRYDETDINASRTPNVAGIGLPFTGDPQQDPGLYEDLLYALDSETDNLARLRTNPPFGIKMTSVGQLGFNASSVVAFDISPVTNSLFAVVIPEGEASSKLYRINPGNGRATEVGSIGAGLKIIAFTVVKPIDDAFAFFTPSSVTGVINAEKSVAVKVLFNGKLQSGTTIEFVVTSGPNTGVKGSGVTDDNGVAVFKYRSNGQVGTDILALQGKISSTDFSSEGTISWEDLPFISNVRKKGKHVLIDGVNFREDDLVKINDILQRVSFNSSAQLKVVKGKKALLVCTDQTPRTNKIEVFRNPATNPGPPIQDTSAFATCP